MTPEMELLAKMVVGIGGPGALVGALTTWAWLRKDVADLKVWREKEATNALDERKERERQQEAWWEAVDVLTKSVSALDKSCAVATGALNTEMRGLVGRVDLHTSTNLSAIIGLVKNYNEMLEETVSAHRSAVELLRTAVMSIPQRSHGA